MTTELTTPVYKSMMLNGIPCPKTKSSTNLDDLDKFLENEKITNSNEPWSKLDKTDKLKKLILFADNYKMTNNLTEDEYVSLMRFFRDCLDKKKLQRIKDVVYNKDTGEIQDVPGLIHNKTSNNFTLKNLDKRISTLKGLAPKKKQGTIKNIKAKDDSDSDNNNDEV
jgi:hypothetical protein